MPCFFICLSFSVSVSIDQLMKGSAVNLFTKLSKVRDGVFTKKCNDPTGKNCEHMITLRYKDGVLLVLDGRRSYKYVCTECGGLNYLPGHIVEDTE